MNTNLQLALGLALCTAKCRVNQLSAPSVGCLTTMKIHIGRTDNKVRTHQPNLASGTRQNHEIIRFATVVGHSGYGRTGRSRQDAPQKLTPNTPA